LERSEKEQVMTNIRFHCDVDLRVVDVLNPARGTEGKFDFRLPPDDMHLREEILTVRLGELLDKLLGSPSVKRSNGVSTASVRVGLLVATESIIFASHLKTLDPAISVEHRFNGDLRQPMDGIESITSLGLFRADLTRLLLDLYGDVNRDAQARVVEAVGTIVRLFCEDLKADNEFAQGVEDYLPRYASLLDIRDWDEVPEGLEAFPLLGARAREVLAKPAEFGPYTVEFANRLSQLYPLYNESQLFSR
jgi:hypothetical protein